jgi:hypothetical protein
MKSILLVILAIFLLAGSSSFATDYYVSTSGINQASCISSPGIGNPCAKIQYVIDNATLTGADIVYLRAGTYTELVWVTQTDMGSGGNYVTFKTYANENVTISGTFSIYGNPCSSVVSYVKLDGRGEDNGKHLTINSGGQENVIVLRNTDYIWLTGLVIDGLNGRTAYGIRMRSCNWGTDLGGTDDDRGAKNALIEYVEAKYCGSENIKLSGWGVDNNEIRYSDIHHVTGGAPGINISASGYGANPPTGNKIHHCNIYNNNTSAGGQGINITGDANGGPTSNEIHDNMIYNNLYIGLQLGQNATSNKIYNNSIFYNGYYGINAYGGNGTQIYNNLIYDNKTYNLALQNGATNNLVLSNTIYDRGNDYGIYVFSNAGTGNIFRNNIAYVAGTGYGFRNAASGTVAQYNDFYAPAGTHASYGTAMQDHNINEDPRWDENFRLTANTQSGVGHVRDGGMDLSSVITTDKDGFARPNLSGWDMGAYEYGYALPGPAAPKGLRIIP